MIDTIKHENEFYQLIKNWVTSNQPRIKKNNKEKQYISFLEPHGLRHKESGSDKLLFHERIKGIEEHFGYEDVILENFILSWTEYAKLSWCMSRHQLEDQHILFMRDDRDNYLDKLFNKLEVETLFPNP